MSETNITTSAADQQQSSPDATVTSSPDQQQSSDQENSAGDATKDDGCETKDTTTQEGEEPLVTLPALFAARVGFGTNGV